MDMFQNISKRIVPFLRFSHFDIFLLLSCIVLITYWPALQAPLTVEDEYNFITTCGYDSYGKIESSFYQNFIDFHKSFINFGRFAPLTVSSYFIKGRFIGVNSFYLHLSVMISWILSGWLMYLILAYFSSRLLIPLVISIFFLTLPESSEIAIRLCSGEALGNLFMMLSIFLIVYGLKINKKFSFLLFVSNLMMSFSKENYVLLLPVLAFAQFWLNIKKSKSSFKDSCLKDYAHYLVSAVLPFLITCTGIGFAIFYSGEMFNYGEPLPVKDVIQNNLWWWLKWLIPYTPIIVFSMFALYSSKKDESLLPILLLCFIFFCTQILAYHNIMVSFSQGRYHMPAIIPFFFGLGFLLIKIADHSKKLFIVSLIFANMIIINQVKSSFIRAGAFTSRAKNFHEQINFILFNKPVMVGIYGGYEYLYSLRSQLLFNGASPQLVYVKPLPVQGASHNVINKKFDEHLVKLLKKDFKVLEFNEFISDTKNKILLSGFSSRPNDFLNLVKISKEFKVTSVAKIDYFNASWKDIVKGNFNRREAESFYIFIR